MIIGSSPSTSRLRQLGCSAENLAYGPEGLAARHCDLRRVTCLDRFKHRTTGNDGGRVVRCAPPTPFSLGTTGKRAFPVRIAHFGRGGGCTRSLLSRCGDL